MQKKTKKTQEETILWATQSVKHKVAMLLIMDGTSFRFSEAGGIVFAETARYVEHFAERLVTCYGCSVRPIFEEYNPK